MSTETAKVAPMDSTLPSQSSSMSESDVGTKVVDSGLAAPPPKDLRFWLIIMALLVATLLAALDLTAIATALPTIAAALRSNDFTWIGTSYSIASAAFVPWSGSLANIYGRRPVLLGSLGFFFVGSVLCGAALNMDTMLVGRTLQGVGAGGILSLTEIVLSDLVSLSERGAFQGAFGAVWALASAIGPVIGGALASTNWRWLFYLNLPLTAIVFAIVAVFINLPSPPGTIREKLRQLDFVGNLVFIPAITLVITGLTYGGNTYPWSDAHVLAPLILGILGLVAWYFVERYYAAFPTVPFDILFGNRTSAIGYATTFIHGISALALFYYWPVFFQAAKGASPLDSAIDFFTVAFIVAPFAMVAGGSIGALKVYKPQNVIAWVLMTAGPGLLSIVRYNSSRAATLALPVPFAMGVGLLFAATTFPVLAPLPPSLAGHALAFLVFVRNFGSIIGITIGSVVLTNELTSRLPASYVASIPGGIPGAYSAIPAIEFLPEALRTEVQTAFANSIRTIWYVLIPFGALGLVLSLGIQHVELETVTDAKWGLEHKVKAVDEEKK